MRVLVVAILALWVVAMILLTLTEADNPARQGMVVISPIAIMVLFWVTRLIEDGL
jgi:hypothetical protein